MTPDDLQSATISHLLALSQGYRSARVLLTALEVDVFSAIGGDRLSATEVAERIGTDPRATGILLNALVALGLLEKATDGFANPPPIRELLVAGAPNDARPGLRYAIDLWQAWSHLTEIVRTGRPFAWEPGEAFPEQTARAMRLHALGLASRLAETVDASRVSRMLDLGGGTGGHAIAFARRYAGLQAVVFDRNARALAIAHEAIQRHGLLDRVSVRHGDVFTDDLGSGYDLVLVASLVCTFGEQQNRILLRTVAEALDEGGRVVVSDVLLDRSMTRPSSSSLFAVHMLVTTLNGRGYSADEVADWLRDAGFRDIHFIPMRHTRLVIGTK